MNLLKIVSLESSNFDLLVWHILILSWIKPNQGQKKQSLGLTLLNARSSCFLEWIDFDHNWYFGHWINCDNGSCKHCKHYSVRGSVIKTYNEPLTDYLQSISAMLFTRTQNGMVSWALSGVEYGGCSEEVWRHERESTPRVTTVNTPWYDTNKCRRWKTRQKFAIIFILNFKRLCPSLCVCLSRPVMLPCTQCSDTVLNN